MSTKPPEPPELSETELARWAAMRRAVEALATEVQHDTVTPGDVSATAAQLDAIQLDMARVRDSLHIPDNAGQFRDALVSIMLRIPEGWGRWISCDAGWFPLIVGLDTGIAALAPSYVLHQVKEKFGCLCYYIDVPGMAWDEPPRQQIEQLIREAEEQSARTCERCGSGGAVLRNSRGWYKTLCDGCADRYGEDGRPFRPVGDPN